MDRKELFRLLDARLAGKHDEPCHDEALWARAGADRAVLVVDLSGFTRVTKKRGILHFLSVHRRAVALALPRIAENDGRCLKLDADNVLASFPRVTGALATARSLLHAADALNATLDEDDRVHVCQAVGFGRVLELDDDVFGDEVNVTFKLGEDVARRGEILITDGAWARAKEEGEHLEGEVRSLEISGVTVTYRALR